MGKDQHVVPNPDGGWQVKGSGKKEATHLTDHKKEAVDLARELAKEEHSELVIHGKDGRIQEKDSHGHDPYPPKG